MGTLCPMLHRLRSNPSLGAQRPTHLYQTPDIGYVWGAVTHSFILLHLQKPKTFPQVREKNQQLPEDTGCPSHGHRCAWQRVYCPGEDSVVICRYYKAIF
jgi:hypothetical protein